MSGRTRNSSAASIDTAGTMYTIFQPPNAFFSKATGKNFAGLGLRVKHLEAKLPFGISPVCYSLKAVFSQMGQNKTLSLVKLFKSHFHWDVGSI